ncbi:hypothetical protein HELRODRAFT_185687 [Helobdella robusta]|uniref:ABC1 atypical kinase-like domain-containing protein n=1 Tax=Helobdella robusta TaxID=6412 RepID=T1FN54_HELRO|nr:hypothetical protein HELRODRAFT_185687 [Helobdella robusta]ESO01555.1 hypothetical protein HELRODRAFT_185687 [Helobdella robusta]
MSYLNDVAIVFRGLKKLGTTITEHRLRECSCWWNNSSLKPVSKNILERLEVAASDCFSRKTSIKSSSTISSNPNDHKTTHTATQFNRTDNKKTFFSNTDSSISSSNTSTAKFGDSTILKNITNNSDINSKRHFSTKTKDEKAKSIQASGGAGQKIKRSKPIADKFDAPDITKKSKESKVPGSRVGRIVSFGSLGAGLAIGTLSELALRGLGMKTGRQGGAILDSNPLLTEANAERIVNTLCRVRGAALKLGQMLSIQDNSLINPSLQKIFERVRQSADFMPMSQMEGVLIKELGPKWRENFLEFDTVPFAAASIGQVHRGVIKDGRPVAVKIQYPGVANSINSDINNLMSLLKVSQVLPEGLYANVALKVARKELSWECDYVREARASEKFRSLLEDDPIFYVPEVIWEVTTKEVLTTELVRGVSLDVLENQRQELRNQICEKLLELCLNEVFIYRFMQTDPNWSNFLYDEQTGRISLIDFGASREFDLKFTDPYIQLIESASRGDRDAVLEMSRKMKFLTGFESKVMENAHVDAVMILGEAFSKDDPFDFGAQSTARRIHELIPVMLKHRLTPPPEETYSLHRKMAGCFLLCSKLKAKTVCRKMFLDVYKKYAELHD